MDSVNGFRHKKYVVFIEKEKHETVNSFFNRSWFILKNIHNKSYTDLLFYSWYYVNMKLHHLTYSPNIHKQMEEFIQ